MADLKAIAEELVNLTVKEVNELATILKDEYGIEPAAAAVAVAAGPAAAAPAEEEKTEFFFISTAGLDSMLHFHVHEPEVVAKHLDAFSGKVRGLLETARAHFREVDFCIFSDHGMTPLTGETDIKAKIEALREKSKLEREKWKDEKAQREAGLKEAQNTVFKVVIEGDTGGKALDA